MQPPLYTFITHPLPLIPYPPHPLSPSSSSPTKSRISVNGNVFIDYYVSWLNQCMTGLIFFTIILVFVSFYVGMCLYLKTMVTDFKAGLSTLDKITTSFEAKQQIARQIKFHIEILEYIFGYMNSFS